MVYFTIILILGMEMHYFQNLGFNSLNNEETRPFLEQFQNEWYTTDPTDQWYIHRVQDSKNLAAQCAGELFYAILQQHEGAPNRQLFDIPITHTFSRLDSALALLPALRILLQEHGVQMSQAPQNTLHCSIIDRVKFLAMRNHIDQTIENRKEQEAQELIRLNASFEIVWLKAAMDES